MIRVVGQREVARQVDLDAVPLADGHRRQDVEKVVEDLRGGLRSALRESLAHEVGAGRGQRAGGASYGDGTDRANRERGTEDAKVMVVDLVTKPGISNLVETMEMVEARGISIGHNQPMKRNGKPALPKALDFAGFPEKLRAPGNQQMLAVVGIDVGCEKALDGP